MSDEQIAFTMDALKKYEIVDSGDAETLGIGAMTDERWQSFFDKSVKWGVYNEDLPLETAYRLEFVNQGHGLDLKRELLGQ